MKGVAGVVLTILAGLGGGAGLAAVFIAGFAGVGGVSNDVWRTNPAVGAPAANPAIRAGVARIGLLALNQKEAVYFMAGSDAAGRPLDEACVYRLTGSDLPARWWSVTLYAEDNYLARNGEAAHAISADSVVRNLGGAFSAVISAARPAGAQNWLASKNAGAFTLTARLYNPDEKALADLAGIELPRIERVSCGREEAS